MRCAETGCCASLLSWSCLSALAAVAVCWQRGDNRLNLDCRKQQQKHPTIESSAICSLTSKVWVLFFHKLATGECFFFFSKSLCQLLSWLFALTYSWAHLPSPVLLLNLCCINMYAKSLYLLLTLGQRTVWISLKCT